MACDLLQRILAKIKNWTQPRTLMEDLLPLPPLPPLLVLCYTQFNEWLLLVFEYSL